MIFPEGVKRIDAVFADEDGTAYDPDSQELKFYDSTGTLIATKTEADCVNTEVGTWYIDYLIPAASETGRWTCEWTVTVGTDTYPFVFAFQVWSRTWPTIQEVRDYLSNLSSDRVSDNSVGMQIRLAANFCNRVRGSGTNAQQLEDAILTRAGWLSYLAYAVEYERTAGDISPEIMEQLDRYERLANEYLEFIKAQYTDGSTPQGLITLVALRTTRIDEDNTSVSEESPV